MPVNRRYLPLALLVLGGLACVCSAYSPFDDEADLRAKINTRLGAEGPALRIPYHLTPELLDD